MPIFKFYDIRDIWFKYCKGESLNEVHTLGAIEKLDVEDCRVLAMPLLNVNDYKTLRDDVVMRLLDL